MLRVPGQLWDSLAGAGVPRGACGDSGVGWDPSGSGPHWGPKGHLRGFWATCGGSGLVQEPEERPTGCWAGLKSQGESRGSLSRQWRLWPGPGCRGASQRLWAGLGSPGASRGVWVGLRFGGASQGALRWARSGPPEKSEGLWPGRGRGWGRGAPAPHKGRGSGGLAQSGAGGS